jgi:hypothetical protein
LSDSIHQRITGSSFSLTTLQPSKEITRSMEG